MDRRNKGDATTGERWTVGSLSIRESRASDGG